MVNGSVTLPPPCGWRPFILFAPAVGIDSYHDKSIGSKSNPLYVDVFDNCEHSKFRLLPLLPLLPRRFSAISVETAWRAVRRKRSRNG